MKKCPVVVDVGFILDSSGSLKDDYQNEKDFLKNVAGTFGIGKDGSRVSVITFSYYSDLSILFKDHFDQVRFSNSYIVLTLLSRGGVRGLWFCGLRRFLCGFSVFPKF